MTVLKRQLIFSNQTQNGNIDVCVKSSPIFRCIVYIYIYTYRDVERKVEPKKVVDKNNFFFIKKLPKIRKVSIKTNFNQKTKISLIFGRRT